MVHHDTRDGLDASSSELRAEGRLQSLDNHRPVTVHFGQVGRPVRGTAGVAAVINSLVTELNSTKRCV